LQDNAFSENKLPSTTCGPDGAWSRREVAWFHTLSLVIMRLHREGRGLLPELWQLVARGAMPDALRGTATATIPLNRFGEHAGGGMSATEAVNKRGTLKLSLTADGLLKGEQIMPALKSLTQCGGKLPRKSNRSFFFTGFAHSCGYSWKDDLADTLYVCQRLDANCLAAAGRDRLRCHSAAGKGAVCPRRQRGAVRERRWMEGAVVCRGRPDDRCPDI